MALCFFPLAFVYDATYNQSRREVGERPNWNLSILATVGFVVVVGGLFMLALIGAAAGTA